MGKHERKKKNPDRLIEAAIDIITGLVVGIILMIIDKLID